VYGSFYFIPSLKELIIYLHQSACSFSKIFSIAVNNLLSNLNEDVKEQSIMTAPEAVDCFLSTGQCLC